MTTRISFADLTHTGQLVATNTFPLGITMIAAYAKKILGDEIEFEIFRYPDDFASFLDRGLPQIACFSIFSWNMRLSHEYALRLKKARPETITVFGGPNVSTVATEKEAFLEKYPAIDFLVEGEGEVAFVELYNILKEADFDAEAVKASGTEIPNTCYLENGQFVNGSLLPRILDLEIIPSTLDDGLSDKFFDECLVPMIQTARGCPYSCTFCHEGSLYFNKTPRFSQERVKREIEYIAERALTPDFIITDLNFGMFPEDLETSRYLAKSQDDRGWPKYVNIATAKNHKDQVLDISKILRGSLQPGAAVQSTDPEVLKNIKRKNLPMEVVVQVARTAESDGACSFSEVILCLPGDSKKAHFQSIKDTIDAGFTLIRTYQFMLLAGTEATTEEYRERFGMDTRYRVKPMNLGTYKFRNEQFHAAEIEEICVSNNTMSYEEYRDCRNLSLTVEIFNNNGIFFDLIQFLALNRVARSELIMAIFDQVTNGHGTFSKLFRQFAKEEERNFCSSEVELDAFLNDPDLIQQYLDAELGINEIYKYRALATLNHMDELHDVVFKIAKSLIEAHGKLDELSSLYIDELKRLSLMRKHQLFDTDKKISGTFNFDFVKLIGKNFGIDPISVRLKEPVELEIYHSDEQIEHINGYKKQFGTSLVGLGRILNKAHIGSMYRSADYNDAVKSRSLAYVDLPDGIEPDAGAVFHDPFPKDTR